MRGIYIMLKGLLSWYHEKIIHYEIKIAKSIFESLKKNPGLEDIIYGERILRQHMIFAPTLKQKGNMESYNEILKRHGTI
jgi:hypothetical protein